MKRFLLSIILLLVVFIGGPYILKSILGVTEKVVAPTDTDHISIPVTHASFDSVHLSDTCNTIISK